MVTFSTLGGSKEDKDLALYHEKVHSFLSPKLGPFREIRADIRMTAYQNSHFMRYLEESLAESYSQMKVNGIKSLPEGIGFPVKNNYVELSKVVKEGAIGSVVVGGTVYSVYAISSQEPPWLENE